jgi:hypothetical protein
MSKRTTEEIRREIAAERQHLDEDLGALQAELRSFVPLLAVGLGAVALLGAAKGAKTGIRLVSKLL